MISPDGFRVLATAKGAGGGEGTLALLDITAGSLRTVGAGTWPYRVAALPDGSAAYVTNPLDDVAHAIDLVTGEKHRIDTSFRPDGVVASPEGDHVCIGHDDDPAVAVVDTAQQKVTRGFGGFTTATCVALTPDGTTLAFGVPPVNMVAVAATSGGGEPLLVPVGQPPEQLVASEDAPGDDAPTLTVSADGADRLASVQARHAPPDPEDPRFPGSRLTAVVPRGARVTISRSGTAPSRHLFSWLPFGTGELKPVGS
ncbi:YncE family protein [Streptomyces sp. NPDC002537]